MSKRRRSKIVDIKSDRTVVERIEAARYETIARLGTGGYIKAADFCRLYKEMTPDLFAQIMYATEQMLDDFDGEEDVDPANIPVTIARHDFRHKQHFREVAEVFVRHVGPGPVQL